MHGFNSLELCRQSVVCLHYAHNINRIYSPKRHNEHELVLLYNKFRKVSRDYTYRYRETFISRSYKRSVTEAKGGSGKR